MSKEMLMYQLGRMYRLMTDATQPQAVRTGAEHMYLRHSRTLDAMLRRTACSHSHVGMCDGQCGAGESL